MTERIYYTEPSRAVFEATVITTVEHGGRPSVVLNRTAFYPTSGGQPFDTGRLGSVDVIETVEDDNGDILHVTSAPIAVGSPVLGQIDWARRFDHMQQHTGQHVLSASFDRQFENRTTSFHMGAEVSTIDLAREASATDIEAAVDEANRIVWENREVAIRFVSAEETTRLPLRKEPSRGGTLRLIEITEFDLSACGGTHVARTGAIGQIAVIGAERFRGGVRVTFVCGGRALRSLRAYRDAVAGATRVLSVLPSELPQAVERVQSEAKGLRKGIGRLQIALAHHEAARLVEQAVTIDGIRVSIEALDGWDAAGLKAIGSALVTHADIAAVLLTVTQSGSVVVVARAQNVAIDAAGVLRDLLGRFGGKGGGRPEFAQGAGLVGKSEEILAAARELIVRSG